LRRRPASLRALPPHAAHRRDRPRLSLAGRGGAPRVRSVPSPAARIAGRQPADAVPAARALGEGVPARCVAARSFTLRTAVDPVTLQVTIDRPREEVFAYLLDIANHPEF